MFSSKAVGFKHSRNLYQIYLKTDSKNIPKNVAIREITSKNTTKPFSAIPSPSSLPIIGHTHHFFPGGQFYNLKITDFWRKLYQTYGPIVALKLIGKDPVVFLYDPESTATVLRGENQNPIREFPEFIAYYRKKFNKESVSELRGEAWKKLRSQLNPILMQTKNVKMYEKYMDEIALELVDKLVMLRDENNRLPTDIDEYVHLWAFESIALVGLGQRLHCLDPNLPKDSPVRKLIESTDELFKIEYKLDMRLSFWQSVATPAYLKGIKVMDDLYDLSRYFIDKAIEDIKKGNRQFEDKKSIFEQTYDLDKRTAYLLAVDLIIGGISTVSATAIFLLYLLARNPEKQNKLREELKAGSENNRYLTACFKESYRVLSAAGGNMRRVMKPYNLLGYEIPVNTMIFINYTVISTSEEQYPRALEFIPERWLVGSDDPLFYGNAHPFSRNANFGFGTRTCIGRRIAELEIEVLIKRIIQRFQVKWDGPDPQLADDLIHNAFKRPFYFVFMDI